MYDKPLFIHIPKTAGTSIVKSGLAYSPSNNGLKSHIKESLLIDPKNPYLISEWLGDRLQKHIPYDYLNPSYVNKFDRVFTVVRNPWSHVVSKYNYSKILMDDEVFIREFKNSWFFYMIKDISNFTWPDYLNSMYSYEHDINYYWSHNSWANQSAYIPEYTDIDILRYEYLKTDLELYFNKKINLYHINKGYDIDYKSYYTEEQKNQVAHHYKIDIERWGFTFDSGATKNYWTK